LIYCKTLLIGVKYYKSKIKRSNFIQKHMKHFELETSTKDS
jgi:hypothetical protein